jgi:hypothetical protein
VQASHNLERVAMTFDDDTVLPNGGLTVAAPLAQKAGRGRPRRRLCHDRR